MTDTWDAKAYSRFLDLRTKPARDLLATIPHSFQPKIVYDLGCGPGNSTILLKERWPQADVFGLDSSPNMLAEARASYPDLNFIEDDIAKFKPAKKIDCLFANASLQWLDDHEILVPTLLKFLHPGGVLAIQMPNNFHTPAHQLIIQVLQQQPAWQHLLKNLRYKKMSEPLYNLTWYYDLLTQAKAKHLQLWETIYYQEMSNYQEIFTWVKGSVLRPVLSNMDSKVEAQFTQAYIDAISKEYFFQTNGKILFPFRRIFMLGFKS